MLSHNCQSAVYVCTNNTKTPHGLLLEMSFVFILIYIDIWCHTVCPPLGQGVFFHNKVRAICVLRVHSLKAIVFTILVLSSPLKIASRMRNPLQERWNWECLPWQKNLQTQGGGSFQGNEFKQMSEMKLWSKCTNIFCDRLYLRGVYYILGYYTAYNVNTCKNDNEPVCHLIKVPLVSWNTASWQQEKVSKAI